MKIIGKTIRIEKRKKEKLFIMIQQKNEREREKIKTRRNRKLIYKKNRTIIRQETLYR